MLNAPPVSSKAPLVEFPTIWPAALMRCAEVWDFTGPIYEAVLGRGEAFTFEDQRLVLERGGAPEETFFTVACASVDLAGGPPGTGPHVGWQCAFAF